MESYKVRVVIKHEFITDVVARDEASAIKVAQLQPIDGMRYVGKSAPEYSVEKDVDV